MRTGRLYQAPSGPAPGPSGSSGLSDSSPSDRPLRFPSGPPVSWFFPRLRYLRRLRKTSGLRPLFTFAASSVGLDWEESRTTPPGSRGLLYQAAMCVVKFFHNSFNTNVPISWIFGKSGNHSHKSMHLNDYRKRHRVFSGSITSSFQNEQRHINDLRKHGMRGPQGPPAFPVVFRGDRPRNAASQLSPPRPRRAGRCRHKFHAVFATAWIMPTMGKRFVKG